MISNSFSEFRYHTLSTVDEAWGLSITTTGYQEIPCKAEYPEKGEHPSNYYFNKQTGRILPEYQLIYITKGKGSFKSKNTEETIVQTGDLFMIFPEEWHVYQPKTEIGWQVYWVGFKGFYADALVTAGFFSKEKPVYTIGLNEKLVSLFQEILEYSKSESPAYQQCLAGVVTYILSQVYSINQNHQLKDDLAEKIVTSAKILMRENIYQQPNPEEIAEQLNISYSLFRRIFKRHTGIAPTQFQHQLRIQKAKELLSDPNKTVKEISFILNFQSGFYFSTYFKRITKYTPSEFRKRLFNINDDSSD